MPARHPLARTTFLLALAGLLVLGGCSVGKAREAARLARASEPLQADPPDPRASLLIVGDSTAVGTGASTPQASVAGRIAAQHPQLRIVNLAADGAKYRDFAGQLRSAAGRFDAVLVLGGGNDVVRLTPVDRLRGDVATTVALARERAPRVILMPPGNVGNAPFFFRPLAWLMTQRAQALHEVVREEAGRHGDVQYVDLYEPREQDPFAQRPREMHASDGLHPSDAGYALWTQELRRQAGPLPGVAPA
ncbi:SGNH/GDSL hydrolase family protein [Ramlibacter rhizophilus]|uniref:SGNH/GDSL hydrolase family protein n=1 Tax=Ramlibacter rhizophilus TaxID=1781167 RepID=A0A4Z0BZP5_9BURK|nr:SGNH/GDSL hydrolase family protein [Ramlibacter rhizophilus]TFZ04827.1 SGNH/GDSL hydrolase family protein [Ramlibacter rhizophilus]